MLKTEFSGEGILSLLAKRPAEFSLPGTERARVMVVVARVMLHLPLVTHTNNKLHDRVYHVGEEQTRFRWQIMLTRSAEMASAAFVQQIVFPEG